MNRIFIQTPEIMRKVAMATVGICLSPRTNCMFCILPEVGVGEKSIRIKTHLPYQRQDMHQKCWDMDQPF